MLEVLSDQTLCIYICMCVIEKNKIKFFFLIFTTLSVPYIEVRNKSLFKESKAYKKLKYILSKQEKGANKGGRKQYLNYVLKY